MHWKHFDVGRLIFLKSLSAHYGKVIKYVTNAQEMSVLRVFSVYNDSYKYSTNFNVTRYV